MSKAIIRKLLAGFVGFIMAAAIIVWLPLLVAWICFKECKFVWEK